MDLLGPEKVNDKPGDICESFLLSMVVKMMR